MTTQAPAMRLVGVGMGVHRNASCAQFCARQSGWGCLLSLKEREMDVQGLGRESSLVLLWEVWVMGLGSLVSLSPLREECHLPFECMDRPTAKEWSPIPTPTPTPAVGINLPSIGMRSAEI